MSSECRAPSSSNNEFDRIPAELRQRDQWVVWRLEDRNGRSTKVPYRANGGGHAAVDKPDTWATFAEAVAAASEYDGIGFVFTATDSFCGVDLDLELPAADRGAIAGRLDSYTEESVSGGWHVIIRASLNGDGRHPHGLGIFDRGRYFVMTGKHLKGTPLTIEERQAELDEVLAAFLPASQPAGPPLPAQPVDLDDHALLLKAFAAKNGAEVEALWQGSWEGRHASQSEADLALCNHLAFWTGRDSARIDRLFRESGLMREKWDARRKDSTYGAQTIQTAIAHCHEVYEPLVRDVGPTSAVSTGSEQATLAEVVETFQRWLYLPDPGPVLVTLGTTAANLLDGDPVWLLLVGPPGSGKSELVQALSGLPDIYPAATLTEAALLSGTPKREVANQAKGGLLRAIGEFGIITAKDFGSVLSMNRDARALVLAALREIYDGAWTRHVGTDGGRTLSWAGKVGLVAGCTPTIDRHHAVMGAMGERFVLYRIPGSSADEQAHRALLHAQKGKQMRRELSAVVADLFANALREPRERGSEETDRLISLAALTVVCRSTVERDGYSREIELIPEAEVPTRLAIVLDRLLAGLDAIGVERKVAWEVVVKAALDSIPATRSAVLRVLYLAGELTSTTAVAQELGYPTNTTRRVLEDLTAHGVAIRVKPAPGQQNVDQWALSAWVKERYRTCVPEMSGGA
jgi:energy-coupling factor transporter ATP-binding protein EcfA2